MMQIETLNDMREAKRAFEEAKQTLDSMGVSLISSITDSIQEYNELYETNYVLSTKDVVKQPEKRKRGRPKGSVSRTVKTPEKSTEIANGLVAELLHSRP